nr:uncharacterized mitochondrial protein AtMg00810-like [Tanacetum cinerariifolium]
MSSMGELTFVLGLQVKQKEDGIFISQDKYVAEILKKFDFLSVKTASTPIETQKPLVKDEEDVDVDVHLYRSMIGSIMYLTASRPNIMFAVYACSRFQVTLKISHLQAVKKIFRYLKGQPKLGIWYPKVSSFDLEAYSDNDYAGANLDMKSTTGGCQFFGRRLISWQCKKQTIMATSTTKAKYVAAAHCCGQVLWIQNQLLDHGFNFMNTKIHIDNESTMIVLIKRLLVKTSQIRSWLTICQKLYGSQLTMLQSKELASPKQTALGKDNSNSLIVDSLLKTIWLSMHHVIAMKHWLFQSKQLLVKTINDEVWIQALNDENRVNMKESSIRHILKLDDAKGTSCLANAEIFYGLAKMGYKKLSEKLTFYKAFFSPQWKFLIHTILQCLGAKTTSWNEFSSTMASAIICHATNQKFNFSRYILLSLVKNIEAGVPFFMFLRFVQLVIDHQLGHMSHHKDIYANPSLTKKVFANMKRVGAGFSGIVTALFDTMLVPAAEEKNKSKKHKPQAPKVPSPEPSPEHMLPLPFNDLLPGSHDSMTLKELMDFCTCLSNKVLELESEVIDIKSSSKERIEKLEGRVAKLEEANRLFKELHSVNSKADTAAPVADKEKSFKHGRIIAEIDEDVKSDLEEAQAKLYKIDLEHPEKVLSMQDVDEEELAEVEEMLEVVKAAKLMTEVVTIAGETTTAEAPKVSVPRRIRGVIIQDPEETTSTVVMHLKNDVMEQVARSERLNDVVMKYQALKIKPLTEAQARKNMIIYLKNMVGFKMNYFKGMTYSEIRPLFENHFNYNHAFLEEVNEEVTLPENEVEIEAHKREGENISKEVTKKQRMDEEAEDLKIYLQIVANDDDDVYTEATHLASKIPVIDYKIHFERNKPYFMIIRA